MLGLLPDQFWAMTWTDFWETVQARMWWCAIQNGIREPRRLSAEEIKIEREELKKIFNA